MSVGVRVVSLVLLSLLTSASAWACATCACGNPTLTSLGQEQPFTGRFRLGGTSRLWQTSSISAEGVELIQEARLDLLASFSVTDRLQFSLQMPLQLRQFTDVAFTKSMAVTWGDIEPGVRFVLFRSSLIRPRILLSALATAQLPTAPTVTTAKHQALPFDAQVSTGGVAPSLGLGLVSNLTDGWSAAGSIQLQVPLMGRGGNQAPLAISSSAQLQYQPNRWVAARASFETRTEGTRLLAGQIDSGNRGTSLFVGGDIAVQPKTDLIVTLGTRIPVAVLTELSARPSPLILLSVVIDV